MWAEVLQKTTLELISEVCLYSVCFIHFLRSPKRPKRLEEVLRCAEGDDSLPAESNLNPPPPHTHTLQHNEYSSVITSSCSLDIIGIHTTILYMYRDVHDEI